MLVVGAIAFHAYATFHVCRRSVLAHQPGREGAVQGIGIEAQQLYLHVSAKPGKAAGGLLVPYLLQTPLIKQTWRFVLFSSGGRVGKDRIIMRTTTRCGVEKPLASLSEFTLSTPFRCSGMLRGRAESSECSVR